MQPIPESVGVVPLSIELAKRLHTEGTPIVGICCEFAPRELILAAGAVPVCLCGGSAKPIPAAEEDLPATLCPLIKSTYGFAITGACPFLTYADLIVAETTCDGKKKMYELLAERVPQTVHVLELPQKPAEPAALEHWLEELRQLQSRLERRYDHRITQDDLRGAIQRMNRERELVRRLHDYAESDPPYVTGRELLLMRPLLGGVAEEAGRLQQAVRSLERRRAAGASPAADAVRILVTGTPMVAGMTKVIDVLEGAGAVVVAQESCSGLKSVWDDVPMGDDPLRDIAQHYLSLPCPCMTPNTGRLALLDALIDRYRPRGVVELIWHACQTYAIEAAMVQRHVAVHRGLPYLRVETDYSESDAEQIRTRVEGFLEMARSAA